MVDTVFDRGGATVKAVVCAFADDGVDTEVKVSDVVAEAAIDGADVVAEGLGEAPVPTGTFWR